MLQMAHIARRRRFFRGASTLALSLFFTSATVNSSGGVTDVDGTGNALTYTGASHKRQWNADGVLEYAPHNLARNSGDFDAANWVDISAGTTTVTVNAANDPDGNLTADQLVGNNVNTIYVTSEANPGAGLSYTFSCWVKTVNSDNHSTQTIYLADNGGSATTQALPADLTNWTQVSVTHTPTTTGSLRAGFGIRSDIPLLVAFPSLRFTNSPSTYIATTSSAVYGPRVGTRNRKPVTNLLSYPEQFDNAVWTNVNSSESGGQTDPFGGTNAFKIVEANTTAQSHAIAALNPTYFQSGKTYTLSAYFKAGERNWVRLAITSGQFTQAFAYFNLSTSEVGTTSFTAGQGIAPVEGATGWYRCWITATATSSGQTSDAYFYIGEADNDVSYNGDGSSGLYIFGAQLNEGGIEDYIGARNRVSNDKDITAWTNTGTTDTGNTVVAPDGTTTGDTLTASAGAANHHIASPAAASTPADQVDNASVFIKKGTHDYATVSYITDASSSAWIAATIDFTTNTITKSQAGASATLTSSSITYWGNGWYRIELVGSLASTGSRFIKVHFNNSNNPTYGSFANESWTAAGTETVYIWGAQLTKGSTLYPYVGMPQTGFTKQGYLAEAAATNLVTDSEDLTAVSWAIGSTDSFTRTANQSTFADGLVTMDKIAVTDTTNEVHALYDDITSTASADYCVSAFVRAEDQRYISLIWADSTGVEEFVAAVYDIFAGTVTATDVGTVSGTIAGSGVIPCGNGLFRIWLAGRHGTTTGRLYIRTNSTGTPTLGNTGQEAYAAAGGEAFYIGGVQVETGTYPSSYIRTSGGTATRAADALSTADVTWHDAAAGAFVASHVSTISSTLGRIFELSGGGDATRLCDHYWASSNTLAAFGAAATSGLAQQTAVQGILNKTAAAYAENDMNLALNGAATIAQDTTFTPLATATNFYIGRRASGLGQLNGFIRSLQYYSERKSDADLATLSTITDDGTTWRNDLA